MVSITVGFKAYATDFKSKLTKVSHVNDDALTTKKNTETPHESLSIANSPDFYIGEKSIFYVDKKTISTLQKPSSEDKKTEQATVPPENKKNTKTQKEQKPQAYNFKPSPKPNNPIASVTGRTFSAVVTPQQNPVPNQDSQAYHHQYTFVLGDLKSNKLNTYPSLCGAIPTRDYYKFSFSLPPPKYV